MRLDTKVLRLKIPVKLGSRFGDWHVYWVGGWTRHRLSYLIMVVRSLSGAKSSPVSPGRELRLRAHRASMDCVVHSPRERSIPVRSAFPTDRTSKRARCDRCVLTWRRRASRRASVPSCQSARTHGRARTFAVWCGASGEALRHRSGLRRQQVCRAQLGCGPGLLCRVRWRVRAGNHEPNPVTAAPPCCADTSARAVCSVRMRRRPWAFNPPTAAAELLSRSPRFLSTLRQLATARPPCA